MVVCWLEMRSVGWLDIKSVQSTHWNLIWYPITELCWKSFQEASNVEGEWGSSLVQEMMSGPTSLDWIRALGRLTWGDVGSDESGLNPISWALDGGTSTVEWRSFPRIPELAVCHDLTSGSEIDYYTIDWRGAKEGMYGYRRTTLSA